MKNITIGFPVSYFIGWMGGASLAANFTNSVYFASKYCMQNIKIIIMLQVGENIIKVPSAGYLQLNKKDINADGVLREFFIQTDYEEIYIYNNLYAASAALGVDVIGPSYQDLGENFEIPWSGYLPDFQHRHFPGFFDPEEIQSRNIMFGKMLANAPLIFVNSKSVIDDIEKLYMDREINSKLKNFPSLLPLIESKLEVNLIKKEFDIDGDYFIICSQQWKHKKHDIAIRAFKIFLEKNNLNIKLIITGMKDDYRYPNLKFEIDELIESLKLEGIVRYLGLIDKAKQIALINGSKALIQASLIEGGPGASGIAEAAALDVPIIATKIMPNIEMNCGRFMYFSVDDVEALAEAMFKTYSSQKNQRFPIAKEEVEVLKLSCGIQLIRMLTSIL